MAPVLGAAILVGESELDIHPTVPVHGDASSEQYVTFASVGDEVVAVSENGAALLVAYSETSSYPTVLGYGDALLEQYVSYAPVGSRSRQYVRTALRAHAVPSDVRACMTLL